VIDLCVLPLAPCRSFSCDMERMLWLLRHETEPLVQCWWIGFEFAQKGRCFERVIFEIKNNTAVIKALKQN